MNPFWKPARYEEPEGMTRKEWLQFDPQEDKRPFWKRLLSSLKVSPKVNAKGVHGIEVKGGAEF